VLKVRDMLFLMFLSQTIGRQPGTMEMLVPGAIVTICVIAAMLAERSK
jgi:hypothetical protein